MKKNQDAFLTSLSLQPADSALFLNGLFFDVDSLDAGALLESARSELRTMEGLYGIGIFELNYSDNVKQNSFFRCETTPDGLTFGPRLYIIFVVVCIL